VRKGEEEDKGNTYKERKIIVNIKLTQSAEIFCVIHVVNHKLIKKTKIRNTLLKNINSFDPYLSVWFIVV